MTLKEHTVKSYDQDLHSIATTLDHMTSLALESLDFVADAIAKGDSELLQIIKKHDYKINTLDFLVEKKVTSMLALRQPMAVDLRYIVSSLKAASNLERIGDQAKSIIKKLLKIGELDENVKKSLLEMLESSKKMILDSAKSFNGQDIDLADDVLKRDDEIDDIYRDLFRIIKQDHKFLQEEVENIVNILFVAKSFERLADNATNIAEIAKYVVTGEMDEN